MRRGDIVGRTSAEVIGRRLSTSARPWVDKVMAGETAVYERGCTLPSGRAAWILGRPFPTSGPTARCGHVRRGPRRAGAQGRAGADPRPRGGAALLRREHPGGDRLHRPRARLHLREQRVPRHARVRARVPPRQVPEGRLRARGDARARAVFRARRARRGGDLRARHRGRPGGRPALDAREAHPAQGCRRPRAGVLRGVQRHPRPHDGAGVPRGKGARASPGVDSVPTPMVYVDAEQRIATRTTRSCSTSAAGGEVIGRTVSEVLGAERHDLLQPSSRVFAGAVEPGGPSRRRGARAGWSWLHPRQDAAGR